MSLERSHGGCVAIRTLSPSSINRCSLASSSSSGTYSSPLSLTIWIINSSLYVLLYSCNNNAWSVSHLISSVVVVSAPQNSSSAVDLFLYRGLICSQISHWIHQDLFLLNREFQQIFFYFDIFLNYYFFICWRKINNNSQLDRPY